MFVWLSGNTLKYYARTVGQHPRRYVGGGPEIKNHGVTEAMGRSMHLQVDVWSLGVVLYAGLVGRPPFETADVKATYKRIKANDYCFPDAVPLSDDAKHLVRWALSPAPEHRPTLSQMLSHPFVVTNRTRPVRGECGAVSEADGGMGLSVRMCPLARGLAGLCQYLHTKRSKGPFDVSADSFASSVTAPTSHPTRRKTAV